MRPIKKEAMLKELERGSVTIITNKFAQTLTELEYDAALHAWEVMAIGRALGETLDEIEYPTHWRRFLKTKNCPKYMREISVSYVDAYYPKLSLPEEEHWVSFEQPVPKDESREG